MEDNTNNLQNLSVTLSSMSPKVNKNIKKIKKKKVNKLALKPQLRRSSIYDKLPHTTHNNAIVSGSDTSETCSSSSGSSTRNIRRKENILRENSQSNEIKKWVYEVNREQNEIESCSTTFNEMSIIIADHKMIKKNDDKSTTNFAINSTFINDHKCVKFHDMFQKKKVESTNFNRETCTEDNENNPENDKSREQTTLDIRDNDVIIINDSYEERQCFETPTKTQNEVSEHEKLLDELYGNSWRANKERILMYSEPRQKERVKIKKKDILPKSERKPKTSITYKNPYLFSEKNKSESLLRTLHSTRIMKATESSPWLTKFKDICDIESSPESLSIRSPLKCKMKLNFDVSNSDSDVAIKNTEDNFDKFINKTPRRVKRTDYNKEIRKSNSNLEKPTGKDSLQDILISCNLNMEDESNVDDKVQNDFYDTMLKEEGTLEDRLIKKINGVTNSSFDNIMKSLEDKLRNGVVLKKENCEILNEDCNNYNKSDIYPAIPDEKLENIKARKTKRVPKSNKNKVQKEERERKTNSFEEDSPSLESKVNKTKKQVKKNIRKKQNDSDKESAESSNDSDSSNESIYINKKQDRSKIEGPLSFLASLSGCIPIDKCDASARIFRSTFKTSKEELARKLFNLYNDKVFNNSIPNDTLLEWSDRMRGTAGFCYCKKITRRTGTVERKARIVLATKILDSADRLRDTLIHEMCHAATWIVNEISDGHGSFWKAWAAKAMRTFPELPPIKRCHDYTINTKYTYKCSSCGYSIGRHSKSLDIERKRCGYCYGKFEIFINKTTKGGIKAMAPATPKKEPTGFALFIKENYSSVKKANMNHAEVMKILSKNFSELKSK
ncbi:hypothetical protein Trydic_g10353 [Trypoxylus dichotomus]